MTDKLYNEAIQELVLIHQEFPDLRLGQVLQMAVDKAKSTPNKDLSDLSTKELLTAFKEFNRSTKQGRENHVKKLIRTKKKGPA